MLAFLLAVVFGDIAATSDAMVIVEEFEFLFLKNQKSNLPSTFGLLEETDEQKLSRSRFYRAMAPRPGRTELLLLSPRGCPAKPLDLEESVVPIHVFSRCFTSKEHS